MKTLHLFGRLISGHFRWVWLFTFCLPVTEFTEISVKSRDGFLPYKTFSRLHISLQSRLECNRKCHYQAERFRSGDKKKCKSKGSWGFPLFKLVTLCTCFTLVCQWELRYNLLWWYAIQVLEVIRWHLILFIGAPAIGKCRFWSLKCSKFWREFWQPFYGLIFKSEGCALKNEKRWNRTSALQLRWCQCQMLQIHSPSTAWIVTLT